MGGVLILFQKTAVMKAWTLHDIKGSLLPLELFDGEGLIFNCGWTLEPPGEVSSAPGQRDRGKDGG